MQSLPHPFTSAQQLKLARVTHDMSQAELATALGTSRETINRIETGDRVITTAIAHCAAILFAYLDKPAPSSVAPAAHARPVGRPSTNIGYCYSILEPPHGRLSGADIERAPPGTRYRMATLKGSNLSGWSTMVRGTGPRHEDHTEASSQPELSNQAWLDSVAKRFE